ncbi:hypothetical protein N7462_005468 [Penicillium macrosclerotiorum]|uniref:uncharacterized protein n=1 Tax=Penicillium macrosclerotiorum TaxID=303699 RepID=UPI00254893AC|nr:uncharacterized protein N7462_005468 [Penicillium macrosclerotiorum]KAJ5682303.1 hypothetical protein N7462_005468 [Penicillium macrosclerotiorum]
MSPTHAAPNMIPDYEVRLMLNPTTVLSPEHELTATVLSAFEMPPTVTKLNVQFLDSSSKELYAADWSARIRKIENEDDFELTYKKRYAITSGGVEAALIAANNDGFNADNAKYEAQVEWGYQKQTLSISRKKTAANSGKSGMDLPGTSNSRKMLIDEAPDKFDNWSSKKWGTETLAVSRIFGPILVRRSVGLWNKIPLYVEIWPLLSSDDTGIEYIVEASFKTKSCKTASNEQTNLAVYLQSNGWLLSQDSLKTQLIMERY